MEQIGRMPRSAGMLESGRGARSARLFHLSHSRTKILEKSPLSNKLVQKTEIDLLSSTGRKNLIFALTGLG